MKILSKLFNISLIVIVLITSITFPMSASADDSYAVSVIDGTGIVETLGTFTNYDEAEVKMLEYESTETKTAVIYKEGVVVSSRYAIVRFTTGTGTLNLYQNEYDSAVYTYTHPDYGVEAAFIDYNGGSRVKLMISGFTGWADLNRLTIVPLPQLYSNMLTPKVTSIRVRSEASTNGEILGHLTVNSPYTYYGSTKNEDRIWYRINYNGGEGWVADGDDWYTFSTGSSIQTYYNPYSSGNLIHYYKYNNGQTYTNLGPKPSYLNIGEKYYSFDGNYFYTTLTAMLDDYRNGVYTNAINHETPFYAYYLYLSNHSTTNYSAEELDNIIKNAGFTSGVTPGIQYYDIENSTFLVDVTGKSVMYGTGKDFIDVGNTYGINAFSAFSTALNESDKGTSPIAFAKFNLFGIGATDSNPMGGATKYDTVKDSIIGFAKLTGSSYTDPNNSKFFGSFYGNKGSGMNIKYASDPYWGEKQAGNYFLNDSKYGLQDYNSNTLGVKQTITDVPLKAEPSNSSRTIYTLKNKSFSVSNMAYIVFDKVYTTEGDKTTGWYKVYTDTALDENRNLSSSSTYLRDYSYGYIREDYLYVENNQPVITAGDFTLEEGSEYNLLQYATASDLEDGNLVETLDVKSTNLDINKPGTYQVTYVVNDKSHFYNHKTVNVTVTETRSPKIELLVDEVSQYTNVDLKKLVKVTDYDGTDLTDLVEVKGSLNTSVMDTYEVTYSVTNSLDRTTAVTFKIKVKENAKPVITASDKTIVIGNTFDELKGVSASDLEDGVINTIKVIENNVKINEPGTYNVTYEVTDSANQKTTKTITVTVTNKTQVDGSFYFDYLDTVDNKLELRGYLTINGMNNTMTEDIKYKIIFVNNDDLTSTYEVDASRITDLSGINRPIYSPDGFTYTHAWFKANIDIDSLPVGNYTMYVQAESNEVFSKALVNNTLYKKEVTSYIGNTNSANIKNNYSDRSSAVTLYVRKKLIAQKTVDSYYNQYDTWRVFEFNDKQLHLKGVSYSYGMDLSANSDVIRKIIFEDKKTFKTYTYQLGSITNGMYTVALPVADGYDKTRAWYDSYIDLKDLPKGEYRVFITTTSNVTDISEFTDIMGRDLSGVNTKIGDKNYQFSLNLEKGNTIELKVN